MFVGKSFWGKWNDLLTNFIIILTREFAMRPWRSLICENRSQTEKTFSIFLCEIGKNRNEIYKRRYYIDSVFVFSDDPNNFAANNSLNSPIFFTFFLL